MDKLGTHTRRALGALTLSVATLAGACGRTPSGGPIPVKLVLGEVGLSPGQFAFPRVLDSDGRTLWVIDKQGRVQRLDEQGRGLECWSMPLVKDGKPVGCAVWHEAGGRELLFIADTHYHRVMVYKVRDLPAPGEVLETPPELVTQFGSFGSGPGEFIFPTDVAFEPSADGNSIRRVFVGEYGDNDRVSIFEPRDGSFVFVTSFGHQGSGAGASDVQFNRPQALEFDAQRRELVIADACNHRVGRFTPDGKLIAWYGSQDGPSGAAGAFNYPYGLVLMGDGTALIAENGNSRVQRLDLATGRSLGIWGKAGSGNGELAKPWGVTVLAGNVYVLDSGNNRVLAFDEPAAQRGGAVAGVSR